MNEQQSQAFQLYAEGQTQKNIAKAIGVCERTVRTWISQFSWNKFRENAMAAPAVIAGEISSQLIHFLKFISARGPDKCFPDLKEAEIIRKMVVSADKYKGTITLPQSMQCVRNFMHYVGEKDEDMATELRKKFYGYYGRDPRNGYKSHELEFGLDAMTFAPPHNDDDPICYEGTEGPNVDTPLTKTPARTAESGPARTENVGALFTCAQTHEPAPNVDTPLTKAAVDEKAAESPESIVNTDTEPTAAPLPHEAKSGSEATDYPQNEGVASTISNDKENENNEHLIPDAPLTFEDFENYKFLLKNPTPSHNPLTRFRSTAVSRSWLEYNLFQFYLPIEQRVFIHNEMQYRKKQYAEETCRKIQLFFKDRNV